MNENEITELARQIAEIPDAAGFWSLRRQHVSR